LRAEDEYNKAKNKWLKKEKISGEVTEEQIAQLISSWTGIPVSQMLEGESEKLLHMEERIHERLINQEEAVKAISEAIRRSPFRFERPPGGRSAFPFLGPTGVGKTELARTLAWFLLTMRTQWCGWICPNTRKAHRFTSYRFSAGLRGVRRGRAVDRSGQTAAL